MNDARRDRLLALLALIGAALYIAAARQIEDSLLSDGVGAGGVPQAVGAVLGLAALALCLRAWQAVRGLTLPLVLTPVPTPAMTSPIASSIASSIAPPIGPTPSDAAVSAPSAPAPTPPLHALLRGAALVLVLLAYAALLPLAGYMLSISALVLASGALAGAALRLPLLWCAAAAGPGLWLLFDRLLQVRMPIGQLWN